MEQTSTLDALVILVFFRIYLDNRLIGTRAERERLWACEWSDIARGCSTSPFSYPASILEKSTHFLLLRFHPLLLFTNLPFSPFSFFFSICFYYKKRFFSFLLVLFCGQCQNIVLLFFSFFFYFWFENKDTFKLILLIKSLTCYLVLCPSSHMSLFINTLALPNFLLGPSIFFFIYKLRFFF